MEIRQAAEDDIPAIVSLLKISLGEGLMPKSEAYWRWKHISNPFGRSPVLLAVVDDEIIGVRAFMRWTWERNGEYLEAVRAVDTATHPAFQGRGVFSKLTKQLLSMCEGQGVGVVFNTPNQKSLPGYLKMGWQKAGRLPVQMVIRRPFSMVQRLAKRTLNRELPVLSERNFIPALNHPNLSQLIEKNKTIYSSNFITKHSVNSLRWRYQDVPVANYFAESIETNNHLNGLLLYRLKETKFGLEFRITDCLADSMESLKHLGALVREKAKECSADYISAAGWSSHYLKHFLSVNRPVGPIVTVRNLGDLRFDAFVKFSNWRPSMGDLELF